MKDFICEKQCKFRRTEFRRDNMPDEMEIEVKCPFDECKSQKMIKVPSYIFDNKQFGTAKIQINKGIVCDNHQFVIFVDKKGKIRSYEKIDMQIGIVRKPKEILKDTTSFEEFINVIGEFATVNLIHALLLDVPVIIFVKTLNDKVQGNLNAMCKELFPELFEQKNPLQFITREEFKQTKLQNLLAIDENGYILSAPWEINQFDFEETLLQKTLGVKEFKAQAIIFKQAVTNLMKRVEYVRDLLKSSETIYEEDLKVQLSEKFLQKKISDYDIDLIKEILKFRFLENISKIKIRSFDKLRSSLW